MSTRRTALVMGAAFVVESVVLSRWHLAAPEVRRDPRDPRLARPSVERGTIFDRNGERLAWTETTRGIQRRRYVSDAFAPVIGYASSRYGSAGVERTYEGWLNGSDPSDLMQEFRLRFLRERPAPGDLRLALSVRLQAVAAAQLGSRPGAIMAIAPRTGEVLASVSFPRYSPNALGDPEQEERAFAALSARSDAPLLDRAVSGLYPPGSTFKVITGAAALEAGVIDAERRLRIDSPWQADPSWGTYAVVSPTSAHGEFDLDQAYTWSENIYFAKIALTLGGERLVNYARAFTIGADIDLDGPHMRSQVSNSGALGRPTLLAATAFGQGELRVTPIQMLLAVSAIANDGVVPRPHYRLANLGPRGEVMQKNTAEPLGRAVSARTAQRIGLALEASVATRGAFASGGAVPRVRVAGKTGTAERGNGYPTGWFVGYAPAERPTIAVVVALESAPQGGHEAATLAAVLMREWTAGT